MRVGVIRGDLPGPVFVGDLEPTSQTNVPVDPNGQSTYLSRPDVTSILVYLTAQGLAASATTLITTTVPVGGPVDVSSATIKGVAGLGAATATQVTALQNLLTQHFVETDVAVRSFQVGMLSKLLEGTYTPDPNRLSASAAIAVVADDGSTAFSAPLVVITGAVHNSPNTGDLTITGTGLGVTEAYNKTVVKVTSPTTGTLVRLQQKVIASTVSGGTTGSVAPTSIVIPASLLNGLGVVGSLVQVEYDSMANTNAGTAATISTVVNGLVTVTGMTRMTSYAVGQVIKISNAASYGNNGTFIISAVPSSSSIQYTNYSAVAGDANNGSIHWSEPAPVYFVAT